MSDEDQIHSKDVDSLLEKVLQDLAEQGNSEGEQEEQVEEYEEDNQSEEEVEEEEETHQKTEISLPPEIIGVGGFILAMNLIQLYLVLNRLYCCNCSCS